VEHTQKYTKHSWSSEPNFNVLEVDSGACRLRLKGESCIGPYVRTSSTTAPRACVRVSCRKCYLPNKRPI
jgi:hypothetical protein